MNEWAKCTLGELVSFEYGKSLTKSNRNREGEYPVIGSNGIVGYHNNYICEGPGIVVGRKGAAGEVTYIKRDFWPIDTTYYIDITENTDIKFIYYLLKSLVLQQYDKSTAIPGLNRNDAYRISTLLPSLPEQRAIVAKLETLLSDLDNAVTSLKQAKDQIKTYRQSVLKAAFTGKLTEEWRKQQTNQPTDWKDTTFGKMVPEMRRGPFGSSIKKSFFVETGYKVYEQQNAIKKSCKLGSYYIDEEKYKELIAFKVNPGDYIVSCAGTMGELYRLPDDTPLGVINQALLRLRLDANEVLNKYFEYYFYYPIFRKLLFKDSKGTAMQNLAEIKSLKWIPISLPTLEEQQQIIEEIDSRFSVADQLEQTIDESLIKAEALKQSLLKQAFEGRLLTEQELAETRQAPDWEPAEKLLERIKASKK